MIRTCDGNDENLLYPIGTQYVDLEDNGPLWPRTLYASCACGKMFNDVDCSVIYPHKPLLTGRELTYNGRI